MSKGLGSLLFLLFCGQLELMATVLAPVQASAPSDSIALIDNFPDTEFSYLGESASDVLDPGSLPSIFSILPNSFAATLRHLHLVVMMRLKLQGHQFQQYRTILPQMVVLYDAPGIDLSEVAGSHF